MTDLGIKYPLEEARAGESEPPKMPLNMKEAREAQEVGGSRSRSVCGMPGSQKLVSTSTYCYDRVKSSEGHSFGTETPIG